MIAIREIARNCLLRGGRVALALAAGTMLLACVPATAQMPPTKERSDITDVPNFSSRKSELIRNGTAANDSKAKDEEAFDKHYLFRLAEMTLASNFDKLANKRDDLKKKDLVPLGRAPSPDLHDRLTRFLLARLPALIADGGYHPAVRQNWTLILADLNSKEPDFAGKGEVPLAEALPELQKLYVDENQHVGVRLAALVGITRHAKANATPEARKRLAQAMTAIVANKTPPKGSDRNTHDFFRRRTIDGLRAILDTTPDVGDEAVAAALTELIADGDVKLYYRCEAAAAIGMLEGRGIKKDDVPQLARLLADLAVQITKRDPPPVTAPMPPPNAAPMPAPRAEGPIPPPKAGGPMPPPEAGAPMPPPKADGPMPPPEAAGAQPLGLAGGGQPPSPPVAPPAPKSGLPRKVQAYFLDCVRQGFKGFKPNRGLGSVAVEADTKKLVDDLSAKVEEMLKLVTDKNVNDTDLPSKLDLVNAGLREMIRAPGAEAKGTGVRTLPEKTSAPLNQ